MSLFEQLGAGLDVVGQVEVPKMHRYAEDAEQGEIAPAQIPATPLEAIPENMTDMKFTHSLIKHLDMLYSRMLAGEISDGLQQSAEQDEETIDIAGLPHIQKHSYYNPGNSAVTEST
tara:strand:- start:106 stop:456 length:351 start_codon:yes stop_codon:yes gene_type:complete